MPHLDTLILKLLSEQEMYGHQVIAELNSRSNGYFKAKTGTVYPLLQSLEEKKFVTSYTAPIYGRERKFYKITPAGKDYLLTEISHWREYSDTVNKIFEI